MVITTIAGIAISYSTVPFPSDTGEFGRISKSLYLIFPTVYILGFAYIFGIEAGVFLIIGFTIVQIFKKLNARSNHIVY